MAHAGNNGPFYQEIKPKARTFATCPRCKKDVETIHIGKRTAYSDHTRPGTKKTCLPRYESVTTAMWQVDEKQPSAEKPVEMEITGEADLEAAVLLADETLQVGQVMVFVSPVMRFVVKKDADGTRVAERNPIILKKQDGALMF